MLSHRLKVFGGQTSKVNSLWKTKTHGSRPYSAEGPTIEKIHNFIKEKGYKLAGKHHQIYLSDPRKTAPEKLKTILRQPIIKRKRVRLLIYLRSKRVKMQNKRMVGG